MSVQDKERRLEALLGRHDSVIVAFSGGVDSAYLSFTAHRLLSDRAHAVTAISPSVSSWQRSLALEFAGRYRLNHHLITTRETEDPDYASNPSNRCYFCKQELFSQLERLRSEWRCDAVLDGSNRDDAADFRPGRRAARERTVLSPLEEAGMSKQDIRERSRHWQLSSWDLPAMPCLSSRFPYGTPITPAGLRQVERAEAVLREHGFHVFRVRHHDTLARIEIAREELERIRNRRRFQAISRRLKAIGYREVTLDERGFRSGSLNENLGQVIQLEGVKK